MDESTSKSNISWVIIIVVVVLLAGAVVFFFKMKPTSQSTTNERTNTSTNTQTTGSLREFTVDGSNFAFVPSTITVNKDDNVQINFKDSGGRHDLVIDGYNVKTDIINQGQQAVVRFVANKAGSFEYYCSVGTHRDQGMKGTLIVN